MRRFFERFNRFMDDDRVLVAIGLATLAFALARQQ
jgi:hypothetical protein